MFNLSPSTNRTLSHYVNDIKYGSIFNVSVAASIMNSEPAKVVVSAPALQGPRQLKVWPERNGTFVVYWKELDPKTYDFK